MRKTRIGMLAGAGLFLIPGLTKAAGAATAGCVSVPVALGLAFLPPEAITDMARERLLGGSGDKSDGEDKS